MIFPAGNAIALAGFFILGNVFLSPLSHAAQGHVCKVLAIGGSEEGEAGIWKDKIRDISLLHGLSGPIVYVSIVPPPQSGVTNKIVRMTIRSSDRPIADAVCKVVTDFSQRRIVSCSKSFPNTQLRLNIAFEAATANKTERRTEELVKYVTDSVFCKPH